MLKSVLQELPEGHPGRDNLTESRTQIASVTTFTQLKCPRDDTTFHAPPNYYGGPWFDCAWVDASRGDTGAVRDPVRRSKWRQLVKLWGFVDKSHGKCALVDVYEIVPSQYQHHPLLVRYRWTKVGGCPRGTRPFYAVKVNKIVAAACVFRDADTAYPEQSGRDVVYLPTLVEVVKGVHSKLLPAASTLPVPPEPVHAEEDLRYSEGSGVARRVVPDEFKAGSSSGSSASSSDEECETV